MERGQRGPGEGRGRTKPDSVCSGSRPQGPEITAFHPSFLFPAGLGMICNRGLFHQMALPKRYLPGLVSPPNTPISILAILGCPPFMTSPRTSPPLPWGFRTAVPLVPAHTHPGAPDADQMPHWAAARPPQDLKLGAGRPPALLAPRIGRFHKLRGCPGDDWPSAVATVNLASDWLGLPFILVSPRGLALYSPAPPIPVQRREPGALQPDPAPPGAPRWPSRPVRARAALGGLRLASGAGRSLGSPGPGRTLARPSNWPLSPAGGPGQTCSQR